MGDDSSQDKASAPPSAAAAGAAPAGNPQQQPASAIRNKVDVPPGFGRRVSSVEVVKNAMPPTKKASVVIFETPDTPKAERRASSWWRNLVMDDDKTAPVQSDTVISPENAGNGLADHHRNISTASVGDRELYAWGTNKDAGGNHNLALFEEPSMPFFSSYLKAHITPGPLERAQSSSHGGHGAKADLGVLLGVYLPTIQHILGVTMFIRLFWLVGIAGLGQTFLLLFLCCFCTFLTCISISAVATNGVVESGGAYFMISRNLGPEFGSAVGILFYLANTVATSMYLVGGVEILLLYIFPGLTFGGVEGQHDTSMFGTMTNSLRFYSTILLLIEFAIVAMGVKFVQMLAPVSLVCVILSILACYAGGVTKTIYPDSGQYVCMYNDRLLQSSAVLNESIPLDEICNYCNINNTFLADRVCGGRCNSTTIPHVSPFRCINGFPGFQGGQTLLENLGPNYLEKGEAAHGTQADTKSDVYQDVRTSFFVLLAIYFPAVTGIFTGANMSGDLKNPQASIPAGTIAANLTTSFVYFSLAFIFGGAIDNAVLRDKNGQSVGGQMVVALLSWPSPWVLLIGSFLSTFGAALQCLCSAPRLLQAIAKDEVIPLLSPFKKVTANNEPFLGLILTTIIAEIAILMGSMDTIAAVVDFFFLMCYAFVNIICTLHSLLGAPNWRPRFKYYHWFLSLLGAVLCFFIMFSTHWDYAIVACLLCLVIYKYVEWKGAKKEWGDGIRGLALTTAQYSLMKIEDKEPHPKNWRPQLLLLLSMQWSKEIIDVRYLNLLNLASQLKAGKGLTVVTAFLQGDPTSPDDKKKGEQVKARMDFDMNQVRLRGFAKTLVHSEDQVRGSMSTLVQSVGLGGLKPNTMLISWPVHEREEDMTEYNTFIEKVHAASINDMAIVVAKGIIDFPSAVFRMSGMIDVYWIVHDGGLCLLMGYLLKQHKVWRGCKLRVIGIAQESDNNVKMQEDLQKYVYQLRIDAKIMIVELADPEISKNAFERTLLMEERTMMMRDLQKVSGGGMSLSLPPANAPRAPSPLVTSERRANSKDSDEGTPTESEETTEKKSTSTDNEQANQETKTKKERMKALDRSKVSKMHTAVRLNELLLQHSANSQLILLNLPKPPVHKDQQALDDYVHYLEVMTDKLNRVIFVRGTGKEVITESS